MQTESITTVTIIGMNAETVTPSGDYTYRRRGRGINENA
jgi:hypothetical protein